MRIFRGEKRPIDQELAKRVTYLMKVKEHYSLLL